MAWRAACQRPKALYSTLNTATAATATAIVTIHMGSMNELIENGVSIIMISSEMEELLGMSDRIVVLHEGRKMGEVMKKDFDQQKILTLASGIALEDKE